MHSRLKIDFLWGGKIPLLILLVIALTGGALIKTAASKYGVGLSYDSISYISTSINLLKGNGFYSFDNLPLTDQPPLYPLIIALTSALLKISAYKAALVVEALAFGSMIFLAGFISFKILKISPLLSLVLVLTVLTSKALVGTTIMAWSESIFILCTLFSFLCIDRFLANRKQGYFILFAITASLAVLTRYIGGIMILLGMIVILGDHRHSLKEKAQHALVMLITTVLPISIWLARNYILTQTLMGVRVPSIYSFSQNWGFIVNTLLNWYLPKSMTNVAAANGFFACGAILLLGLTLKTRWKDISAEAKLAALIFLFTLIYVSALIVSASTVSYDQIQDRLLIPVYIPVTLLLFFAVDTTVKLIGHPVVRRIIGVLVVLLLVAGLSSSTINTYQMAQGWMSTGIPGANTTAWRESSTANYLHLHQITEDCVVYSNGPEIAYLYGNVNSIILPSKTIRGSTVVIDDVANVLETWSSEKSICIIWFDTIKRTQLFSVDDLREVTDIQNLVQLDDGAIYKLSVLQ